MFGSAIIVFREVLEAALIIGIVLAASRGIATSRRWVALGVIAGIAGALVVAAGAGSISEAFEGIGQEILNAAILFTAVLMLALAQRLDAQARRRDRTRHACRGPRRERGHAPAARAGARRRACRAARRLGGRPVPLRHRRRRRRIRCAARGLPARARGGCRRRRTDVLRPAANPDPAPVLRDGLAHRAAGGRHGRPGRRISRPGRRAAGARRTCLGCVGLAAGTQPGRPVAARAGGL